MTGLAVDIRVQRNADFSDLSIECDDQAFPVHKIVVCSKSPVIDRAVKSDSREGKTITLSLGEFDADTVNRMIDTLYLGDYSDELSSDIVPEIFPSASEAISRKPAKSPLTIHERMARIGDYLQIETLKKAANDRIAEHRQANWKKDQFISHLAEATQLDIFYYLKEGFIPAIVDHMEDLIKTEQFTKI